MVSRRSIVGAVVAGLIATAIGIALSYAIHWFPVQASTQAHNTDSFYHVLVIASVPIFVLVVTVILYSVWKFRVKPGQELPAGPPMTVNVTGQQFAWSYEYPRSVTGGAPLKTTKLYVPDNEAVQFEIKSLDVIHAFWIPAFRLQIDAVPGITTSYRATPNRLGSYPVVCNLLCGVGHGLMRSSIHVVTPPAFQAWLKSQTSGVGASASQTSAPTSGASAPSSGA